MNEARILICPYCGDAQPHGQTCRACGGHFDPLSRQATHNAMGPWFLREPNRPFQPGCSYHTLVQLIGRGRVSRYTIVRGPTTGQYWTVAKRVPGVAHLLGYCHACGASVDAHDHGCRHCGASFRIRLERDHLGLPEIRPLPGEPEAGDVTVGAVREATQLGISSFASDAELLGHAAAIHPVPPRVGPATEGANEADLMLSPAGRAMQRTLAHAQRRSRRLLLLLVLCLVVIAILAAPPILRLAVRNSASASSGAAPPTAPPPDAVARRQPELPPGPASGEQAAASTGAALDAGAQAVPAAAPEPARDAWSDLEDEALLAAKVGADESMPVPQRIAAYERAQAALRRLEAEAPPERRPPDLAARIEALELAAERLRLKDFFP
jgi:hypothetical protein